jgi:hypothetical protein
LGHFSTKQLALISASNYFWVKMLYFESDHKL